MYKTRIFSNHKDVSYNDYIQNKRRFTMASPEMQTKIIFNNYFHNLSCDKAPMKIVDFPTSFTCNSNNHNLIPCKDAKNTLYPYGHYMCGNVSCITCINKGSKLDTTVT